MPFIKISTLKDVPNRDTLMRNVEQSLYNCDHGDGKLMPPGAATCLWQTLDSIVHNDEVHHDFKKELPEVPVFVDLYINTKFDREGIDLILETIAVALSNTGEIQKDNVFIHIHLAIPGYAYISGSIS